MMTHPSREQYVKALEAAKLEAFESGQYVGQESFMTAQEIQTLALRAGLGPDSQVLDLCCGIGGPALHVVSTTGCRLLGIDRSSGAVEFARQRARELNLTATFSVAEVPPRLDQRFDTAMLLETILAFPDKAALLASIAELLTPNGTFVFTLEEGQPLGLGEMASMPESATVCLTTIAEMERLLALAGFKIRHRSERTAEHRKVARDLALAYHRHSAQISAVIGVQRLESLVRGHTLWSDWMASGRVRKFAIVAQKRQDA